MRKLQTQLVTTATLLALTGVASAADLAVKAAPPPPAPVASWTGCHVGINAGAGFQDQSSSTLVPATGATGAPNTLLTIPFDGSLGWGSNLNSSNNPTFTGGGQVGCDYQFGSGGGWGNWLGGNWVVGLEADFQAFGDPGNRTTGFISTASGTGFVTNQYGTHTPWFGTVRARLGTTFWSPSLLAYVTGGFAYGREDVTDLMTTQATPTGAIVEQFPFSTSKTQVGWTAGGGLEYMFATNWQVRVEYLFVSLKGNDTQVLNTTILGAAALATDAMQFNPGRDKLNIIRAGLDYKFW
jgi:outer membrane immunogenic protein